MLPLLRDSSSLFLAPRWANRQFPCPQNIEFFRDFRTFCASGSDRRPSPYWPFLATPVYGVYRGLIPPLYHLSSFLPANLFTLFLFAEESSRHYSGNFPPSQTLFSTIRLFTANSHSPIGYYVFIRFCRLRSVS